MYHQYTLDDYLYNLSIARISFMAIDNTHTKYLHGADKKVWNNYKEALEAQSKFDNFFESLGASSGDLKDGEEYEVPVHQPTKKK